MFIATFSSLCHYIANHVTSATTYLMMFMFILRTAVHLSPSIPPPQLLPFNLFIQGAAPYLLSVTLTL